MRRKATRGQGRTRLASQGGLADEGEHADARERRAAVGQTLFRLGTCRLEPACDEPVGEGGSDAPGRLHLLEDRPGGGRDLIGEHLDGPRTTGRVGHPSDVRLVREDDLGVAGQPPRHRHWRRRSPTSSAGR